MPDLSKPNNRKYAFIVFFAFGLDQLSKWLVLHYINLYERITVIPGFFDLTLVYNPGAAFSFLANAGGWQKYLFMALALAVCVFFTFEIKNNKFSALGKTAASFIMGGALGNALDRLMHTDMSTPAHGVVDYFLFYYQQWSYPAFNVADSFICVGAFLLIVDMLKNRKQITSESEADKASNE